MSWKSEININYPAGQTHRERGFFLLCMAKLISVPLRVRNLEMFPFLATGERESPATDPEEMDKKHMREVEQAILLLTLALNMVKKCKKPFIYRAELCNNFPYATLIL